MVCGSSQNSVSPSKHPASYGPCLWLPLCDLEDLGARVSHLGLQGRQGRGHQIVSRNWHVRARSCHCPHHARIGALPVWLYGSVRGTSPMVLSTGLQPEVPMAGIADQNLHHQLSNRKLIITTVLLSSSSVLVRLHEDPPQMGKHPPACTRIKTEKGITC